MIYKDLTHPNVNADIARRMMLSPYPDELLARRYDLPEDLVTSIRTEYKPRKNRKYRKLVELTEDDQKTVGEDMRDAGTVAEEWNIRRPLVLLLREKYNPSNKPKRGPKGGTSQKTMDTELAYDLIDLAMRLLRRCRI